MTKLPCSVCTLGAAGTNNCNEFSSRCNRFTPIWGDRRYATSIVSDGKQLIAPDAHVHIGNPMAKMDLEKVIRDYHVECFLRELEALG